MLRTACLALVALAVVSCSGKQTRSTTTLEARSLDGRPLHRPDLDPKVRARHLAKLATARTAWEAAPEDPDAIVWYGRRTAYLGRYREAIDIYSRGLELHPDSPHLLRHRGHRYLTVRLWSLAIRDLERAAKLIAGSDDEVEPDGLPNARNTPTSTLHSNIWYHLGLAYFLESDFEQALRCYRECLTASRNPDMLAATSNWLYLTLRRLGRGDQASAVLAPIHADMDIIENTSYQRLLLLYKGELSEADLLGGSGDDLQSSTIGFGVGQWHLLNGRGERARELWLAVRRSPQWAAFGYLGAEAELSRAQD